jgi:hypothetical protein
VWNNDTQLDFTLDQYDVRNLVTSREYLRNISFPGEEENSSKLDMLEVLCDLERYLSLIPKDWEPPVNINNGKYEKEISNPVVTPPPENKPEEKSTPSEMITDVYQIPHEVPPGMLVPKNETQYKIIKRTADFYHKVGKERFSKLHTTQSSNPSFSFLIKNDSLYPYFKFLTRTPVQQQQQILLKKLEEEKKNSDLEQERSRVIQMINQKEPENALMVPSRETCYLIEKVVSAVVEFGRGLEDKLKYSKDNKEDPLYSFLKPGNIYRPSYDFRIKDLTESKMNQFRKTREKKYNDEEKTNTKKQTE